MFHCRAYYRIQNGDVCSGLNPNWHLEVVSVTDLATKVTYWFECNKWFDKSKDDGKIERVLRASLTPPTAAPKTAPYQVGIQCTKRDLLTLQLVRMQSVACMCASLQARSSV